MKHVDHVQFALHEVLYIGPETQHRVKAGSEGVHGTDNLVSNGILLEDDAFHSWDDLMAFKTRGRDSEGDIVCLPHIRTEKPVSLGGDSVGL